MQSARVPGIVGIVDPRLKLGDLDASVRAMAARVATHPGLGVEVDVLPPAALGRVDLGRFDVGPIAAGGSCRLVLCGEVRGIVGGGPTILRHYLARGESALCGLTGSFALALWDGRLGRLYLVNDRFGLRNVYYATDGERLAFAPEVGALLAGGYATRTVDPQAAAEFLTFQCVLGDRTLVRDVQLLPPAALLAFEPGGRLRLETTWRFRYRPRAASVPLRAHAEALATTLVAAVEREVTPGTALPLSGGLDSRTLLAAALRAGRLPPTITYGHPDSDDMRLATRLAAMAGAGHHTILLPPGYLAAEAQTMVARTDGMHSCLNAHASLLRHAGTVAGILLLGNGGDCLLDGLWMQETEVSDREAVGRLMGKLTLGASPELAARLVDPTGPFGDVRGRALAGLAAAVASVDGDSLADRLDAFNVIHRHRRWVLQGVPAQATHVEFRHPYYDPEVVAVASEVPAVFRARRLAHVAALRLLSPGLARVRRQGRHGGFSVSPWRRGVEAGAARLADAIRWRVNRAGLNPFHGRRARGSFSDYNDELRRGSRSLLEDVLLAPPTLESGRWRPDAVRALVADHLAGRHNVAHVLGVVLTLELFARMYLEERGVAVEPAGCDDECAHAGLR